MKKKIIKDYTYHGFGFPVELHNVEMITINGEMHPKIDVKKVADMVMKSLVAQEDRLTGNQIKFVRTFFSMSLREFAKIINESHMAVKKWENYKNEPTNMDRNIEIMLRLYIFDHVSIKSKNDKEKIEFYNQYLTLTKKLSRHQPSVSA